MTGIIKCFWLEPTDQVEVSYRRYRGYPHKDTCAASGYGYHNASVVIERGLASAYPDSHGDWDNHDHPGWPKTCACGYVFLDSDDWQCNPDELLRRSDTGELVTADTAPAGAMRHVSWMKDNKRYIPGPDGIVLAVKLPKGAWWVVDGPTSDSTPQQRKGWTRTGTVPDAVTAMPSINNSPNYHGWLRDGHLHPC